MKPIFLTLIGVLVLSSCTVQTESANEPETAKFYPTETIRTTIAKDRVRSTDLNKQGSTLQ